MTGRTNGRVCECVVIDLNTQYDFCDIHGADPVANIDQLIPALRHMIAWTKRNQVPVVSSIEAHRPTEMPDNGHPLCCLDGSAGQRKMSFTMFRQYVRIEVDNTLSCPMDIFGQHQQVIFRKRTNDLLGNPKADRLLTQIPTREFILFGVSIEGSVKALALGLLARERRVTVVYDAGGYWSRATADLAIRQIAAKGAKITTVSQLLRRKLDRNWRYPSRASDRRETDVTARGNGDSRKNGSAKSHPLQGELPDLQRTPRISKPDGTARDLDA